MLKLSCLYKFLLSDRHLNCYDISLQKAKHEIINRKITNFLIYFFRNRKIHKKNKIFFLKSYPSIIEDILYFRKFIKKIKNFHLKLFVIKIILISNNIYKILRLILSIPFQNVKKKLYDKNKKNILLIGFPYHALNISKNPQSSFLSSLKSNYNFHNIYLLDGYDRKKRKENLINFEKISKIEKNFSLSFLFKFFKSFVKLQKNYFFEKNFPLEICLEIFYKQLKSLKYDLIITNLEKFGVNFEYVVFLQFNNPNISSDDKYVEYFYADNIFIPPLGLLHLDDCEIKKKIPFRAFSISSNVVGLSDNIITINKFKEKQFDFFSSKKNSVFNINPCFLGFEKKLDISTKKNILIFDIPPEKKEDNLLNHVAHDCLSTIEYSKNFIDDFVEISKKKNYNFYLKPKYTIEKFGLEYKNKILEIEAKNFFILDPYSEINLSDLDVNFIFTSPFSSVNKILNKKNICWYYAPTKYKDFIYPEKNILFGLNSLNEKIN